MTPKTRARLRWGLLVVGVLALPVAYKVAKRIRRHLNAPTPAPTVTAPLATAQLDPNEVVEVVYDGALKEGWYDFGWAPRELGAGAAKLNFAKSGGWILAKPSIKGTFGALVFRMK